MKIEFTIKECIYLIPSITNESVVFLFWIFHFNKPTKLLGWITPFIAIRYNKGIDLWIAWLNWGFSLKLELFKFSPKD